MTRSMILNDLCVIQLHINFLKRICLTRFPSIFIANVQPPAPHPGILVM